MPEILAETWSDVRVMVGAVDFHGHHTTMHTDSYAQFLYQASDLIAAGKIQVFKDTTNILDLGRSRIAHHAMQPQAGFTHLYMFDVDMDLELQHIHDLLLRKVDIVSGTYFMRCHKVRGDSFEDRRAVEPFPCVASRDGKYITRDEIESAGDTLIQAHCLGAGALLVTTEALRQIGTPAFKFEWHIGGNHQMVRGEDEWFAQRATGAGYTLWLDPKVRVNHYSYMKSNYELQDFNGFGFFTPNY